MKKYISLLMLGIVFYYSYSFSAQLVIDTVGTYDTPQKMMQAIDDNFDELYGFWATIDTEAEFKTAYNLEIGIDVQAYDSDLDIWAGITPSTDVQTLLGSEDLDAMLVYLAIAPLISLSGVAQGSENLGEFTGTTIPDNQTIKAALQALETALEAVGGGTPINSIGDATGDGTVDLSTFKQIWTSILNAAGAVFTLTNTTADLTADVSFFDFKYTDDGDVNGYYLRGFDNNGTDLKWYIGADGIIYCGGIDIAPNSDPYMELKDLDAPGTDKESFKIYSQYIDGADGSENHDVWFAIKQAGSYTDLLQFDESDDQWEFKKDVDLETHNLKTTGTIKGRMTWGADITGSIAHNTTDLHNTIYHFTAAATVTLDAAADAGYGSVVTYKVRDDSEAAVIDVQAGEKINLDGTALSAGTAITATGKGKYVTLISTTDADGSGTDGWETLGNNGFASE